MRKVTVYIPCHNYGRYLARAIDSVLAQTMSDWELIVIDDGSTDNTQEVLQPYRGLPRIRMLQQRKQGLTISNNIAVRLSNARYVMRLDADDYLDENALMVMSSVLDTKPDVGLVYPDYYLVDEEGEVLKLVRRKKIGTEAELLDLPAHGACTMIRRDCLVELGGYEETISCQDGYELWLRFLQSFKPYNVNVPLFYYRQHGTSLTSDARRLLSTRSRIKRDFVRNHRSDQAPRVLGIVPVMGTSNNLPDSPFTDLDGKPLIWHTLTQAVKSGRLERIVLTSNDDTVLEYAKQFDGVSTVRRPDHLASPASKAVESVKFVLSELEKKGERFDAVMLLYINAPLRRATHINTAIDAMVAFEVDSVVSVTEELAYCYQHGMAGLEPVEKSRDLKLEKKGIYKETGAVFLARTSVIDDRHFVGGKTGHIVMLPEESVRIKTDFDLWMARQILVEWRRDEEESDAAPGARASMRRVDG